MACFEKTKTPVANEGRNKVIPCITLTCIEAAIIRCLPHGPEKLLLHAKNQAHRCLSFCCGYTDFNSLSFLSACQNLEVSTRNECRINAPYNTTPGSSCSKGG